VTGPRFRLVFTDERCLVAGQPRPAIPTILGPNGIVEAPSDWLRTVAVKQRAPKTSLLVYAKILREFFEHLNDRRKSWREVNDEFFIEWRDAMLAKGTSKGRVNNKLRTVFHFYLWAEKTNLIRHTVQLSERGNYPISTNLLFGKYGSKYTSPLLIANPDQPTRHTPTDAEVDKLHEGLEGAHACRDGLILSWAEETGMRREEILSLQIGQIPNAETIFELQNLGKDHAISIKGKGGKYATVTVQPELLTRTRDYLDFEREEAWQRARGRNPLLRSCTGVFLSERGTPLHPDSASRRISRLFKKADIPAAALHRLRAVYITRLAELLVEKLDERGAPLSLETIVLLIMQAGRWKSPTTIRYYVNEVRARRASRDYAELPKVGRLPKAET
jgi:integrase